MLTKSLLVSVVLYGLLNCTVQSSFFAENGTKRNFVYNVYEYDTLINITVNSTTEQILDFNETSDKWCHLPTRVHVSTTDIVDGDHPVFVTATQQKGVSSWELPLVVQTSNWRWRTNDMARTLCPHDAGPNITTVNRPTIQITTSNPTDVPVAIKLRRVTDFFIEVDKEVYLNVTPSSPKYYYFSFDSDPPPNKTRTTDLELPALRFNYTIPKSVILIVESDDDICAVISIQNNSCPVFDNEQDVNYQGYHLTMMNKGGITLTQSMFSVGFYVVFIVKQSDEDCTGASEMTLKEYNMGTERVKSFRFRIIATISYAEYVVAALVVLAVLMLLLALSALISCFTTKCTEQLVILDEEPAPSTSRGPSDETPLFEDKIPRSDSFSSDGSEPRELVLTLPLTVAGLNRRPTYARRSDRYFWSALTVAVVYALPVVQLLFMYQRMVFQTGNQDLCYYNFFCAHPLGPLADFNHVYSNIGYVLLGIAFMAQVRVRQVAQRKKQGAELGIPPHHGIFYSMGLALSMEGILSACYHLCPNKMNFQFDSSFMYVIAVLCMIKLYQNRHPDVNANAHSTFMLLAVVMTIGLFGIMYPSVYFWVLFTILHLTTCFMLTMKIYYVGQFKFERAMFRRAIDAFKSREGNIITFLRPSYGARAILLAVANAANWALAAYGMYEHNKDLARHLLAILMGNTVLYLLGYVIMKLVNKEKVPVRAWMFCALAHLCWIVALYLFLDGHTRWADTPAQSRRRNAVCSSLQFFDSHDLWHAASAAALYLSFNMLLTIDDPLADTPRELIPVF
ncbi:SID1 transmembrane family member 1-like [Cydia strobilella]|uniref:SID1 transmembrane family member 1-like n=1 Tax=Cydia strobilella TaxID=1100964 RepID=UPI003007AF8B